MNINILLSMASASILIGCMAPGPNVELIREEQGFLEKIRGCGESAMVTRSKVYYDCSFADCRFDLCLTKFCFGEKGQALPVKVADLKMSDTECSIELKPADAQ